MAACMCMQLKGGQPLFRCPQVAVTSAKPCRRPKPRRKKPAWAFCRIRSNSASGTRSNAIILAGPVSGSGRRLVAQGSAGPFSPAPRSKADVHSGRESAQRTRRRPSKSVPAAQADLLQGFQAVRNKRRTDDQQLFDAALRQPGQFKIRVRFQPRIAAQPGLEGYGKFLRRNARPPAPWPPPSGNIAPDNRSPGLDRECRSNWAWTGNGRRWVGFAQMPFRNAVKTEQQMVVPASQMVGRAGGQRRNDNPGPRHTAAARHFHASARALRATCCTRTTAVS